MDEVRVREDKHIEAEESNNGMKEKETEGREPNTEGRAVERSEPPRPRSNLRRDWGSRNRNCAYRPIAGETYTPLRARSSVILDDSLHDGTIRRPSPFVGTMGSNSDSYRRYHRTDDHTTDDDCWMLKQQIKQLIQRGHLKKFVKDIEKFVEDVDQEVFEGWRRKGNPGRKQERGEGQKQRNTQEETEHDKDNKGYMRIIARGFSGGGASPS